MALVNLLCAGWSGLVFLFLYIPIVLLVVYSFNASELNVIRGGFSFEWYGKLWLNAPLIQRARTRSYSCFRQPQRRNAAPMKTMKMERNCPAEIHPTDHAGSGSRKNSPTIRSTA